MASVDNGESEAGRGRVDGVEADSAARGGERGVGKHSTGDGHVEEVDGWLVDGKVHDLQNQLVGERGAAAPRLGLSPRLRMRVSWSIHDVTRTLC